MPEPVSPPSTGLGRPRLALAIPTYRRSAAVAANMRVMVPEARRLGIAIHVSDDSPDTAIADVVAQHADVVAFHHNPVRLGHDGNVVQALLLPDADFVWLLGDTLRPAPGCLAAMLAMLDDQDFLFVNAHSRERQDIGPVCGAEGRDLLRRMLWHQTLTGATIYGRRVTEWARAGSPTIHRNFPQISIVLGYSAAADPRIGWVGRRSFVSERADTSYWRDQALDVFVTDWANVVTAFAPMFGERAHRAIIKSHSRNTRLFRTVFLAELRRKGCFVKADFARNHFRDAMHLSPAIVAVAFCLPRLVLGLRRFVRAVVPPRRPLP